MEDNALLGKLLCQREELLDIVAQPDLGRLWESPAAPLLCVLPTQVHEHTPLWQLSAINRS